MRAAASKRNRLTFQRPQYISDGYGNTRGDFEDIFEARGSIRAKFGGEEVTAARLAGVQPITVSIRSTPMSRLVDESWRIYDKTESAIYNIRSIANPDQRNRMLEMLCHRGKGVVT